MDPTPELVAQSSKTVTALCIILTMSWSVFIGFFLMNRRKIATGDRLALIDTEFSMSTDYDKSWNTVPATPFSNPSI